MKLIYALNIVTPDQSKNRVELFDVGDGDVSVKIRLERRTGNGVIAVETNNAIMPRSDVHNLSAILDVFVARYPLTESFHVRPD